MRVHAVGVNHIDLDIRSGLSRYPLPMPHLLGREVAGVVSALGCDAGTFKENDRVWILSRLVCSTCHFCLTGRDNLCDQGKLFGVDLPGGYAEYIKVPATALRRLPESVTFEQAAAFQIAFGTAWHSMMTQGGLRLGQTVLINSAGSGVGSAALQVAKLAGATVFASASSEEKLNQARQHGADHTINVSTTDPAEYVKEVTGGKGVDVVMENAGGPEFARSIQSLRKGGTLVVVGAHAGEVVDLDLIHLFRRELRVNGSRMASTSELAIVMDLVAEGKLSPVVHRTFPLSSAREAHELLESRKAYGKVVLTP